MKNIYVGNLDYNVNEDELRQTFEPYGQVDNVTIMRDRWWRGQPSWRWRRRWWTRRLRWWWTGKQILRSQ